VSNVLPFRPKRGDVDVQHVSRFIFFAMSDRTVDAPKVLREYRRRNPDLTDVDMRLAFNLTYRALCGLERLTLDHGNPDGEAG
jgi:hypothetical protein